MAKTPLPQYTGQLIPAPQKVLGPWQAIPAASARVVIGPDSPAAVELGRELLQQRLADLNTNTSRPAAGESTLTIILGLIDQPNIRQADRQYDLKLEQLVLPAQGYAIRIEKGAHGPLVIAAGQGARGAFYAAATLIQMLGRQDGQAILKMAPLNDWPCFQHRFVSDNLPVAGQNLLELALYKINGYAIQQRYEWRDFGPDSKPKYGRFDTWKAALQSMKQWTDKYDLVDTMYMVNIYAASKGRYPLFNIASEENIAQLVERLQFAADMGVDRIMVLADDWTPMKDGGYVLPHADERRRFGDIAGHAHGYLMRRLDQALRRTYPGLQLSFCPAVYSMAHVQRYNAVKQKRYLSDLAQAMPADVPIVWTGPKICSDEIKREDYLAYSRLVLHHPTYLWNNAGRISGVNPVLPQYAIRFYDGFASDSGGMVYVNGFFFSKNWSRAMEVSANSYYWNPNDFDATASHADATEKLFGAGTSPLVARYLALAAQIKVAIKRQTSNAESLLDQMGVLLGEMSKSGLPTRRLRIHFDQMRKTAAAKPPQVRVPRFDVAPRIDGRLDDPVWKQAGRLEAFTSYHAGRKVDSTTGLIGWDDSALYLAFRASHSQPLVDAKISALRDASIFKQSDVIEIFLRDDETGPICHLAFDHAGNRYDECRELGGVNWNPEWSFAITQEKDVWQAEIRIPFASLQPPFSAAPHAGTLWTANFCRSRAAADQLSSWSPTYGQRFATPRLFGRLEFR